MRSPHRLFLYLLASGLFAFPAVADDLVEFLSGSKVSGKMLTIRREAKEFDFEVSIGDRTVQRTFRYDQVEAVTISGKRYVLNAEATPDRGDSAAPDAGDPGGGPAQRSRADIEKLIEDTGSLPPDWYDQVQLQYPPSLDLSWPLNPAGKGWQANRYVFHYLWSNVYPNPSRWKSGVKLIHHILPLHRDDRARLARDMRELGHMYFRLMQDYPRAAFWYRMSGVEQGTPARVHLAECYWRLGSKTMAMEELSTRNLPLDAIKLYSDMGETERALQLVEAFARSGQTHEACLLGGDACRAAGRPEEAIRYYERVLDDKVARNAEYLKRFHARAAESIEAIRLAEQADPARIGDGTFSATATAYAGPMEVEVTVAGGRIQSVQVTKHRDKQFYSALADIPRQIVARQSIEGVDAISGATVTSQAIVNGAAKALANAPR